MSDTTKLKESGNDCFKSGKFQEALSFYSKALETGTLKDLEKAVIYKNKAACYLKIGKYQEAVDNASSSLEFSPNDPKALFRRCQALENLNRMEEAYKDAAQLIKIDPVNKAVQPVFKRLNTIIQEKIKQQSSTTSKVSQMFNIAFDAQADVEKRIQSLNNLIVLSREEVGCQMIMKNGGVSKLKHLLFESKQELVQGALRVVSTLVKGSQERCATVLKEIELPNLLKLLSANTDEMASTAALLIQNLISYYTGLEDFHVQLRKHEEEKKKGGRKMRPQLKLEDYAKAFMSEVMGGLVKMLVSAKITAHGRNSAMELITKNVTSKEGADWTKDFLETEGVENLLTVAGAQKEFKTIPITDKSALHASVALSKIYDDLINDKLREKFKEKCHEYFRDLFSDNIFESKIEAVAAVSVLLQGTYDVGSMIIGLEGVNQLMFSLADSDNKQYQRVAVEAIVNSASKKDKCSGILKDAVPILKKLYQSSDDNIKVRALVGLCKLGSFGGTDASTKTMAEGSTERLARICRKFLINADKDSDLRKWATEGLAYLTLDADIKEELIEDTTALKSIFSLAKDPDRNSTYAAVTVLVNLTNSYDKQDVMPELLELAKFAKQHVPKEHQKDTPEYVSKRIHKLAEAGVVNALVALTHTDSQNSRELMARVYLSLATEDKLRGLIVQQGGVKSLLNLINDTTDTGTTLAAHSLAKVAVTSDPQFAFPGQRVYEMVRPMISLLHANCSGLQNFEALLALTNLSSVSESVRNRIVSEKGIPSIEHYMYEEHEMLRRASTECMCNMVMSEKVQDLYEGENDRVKVLVLYAGEDDISLVRAATGALAVLSSRSSICHKIVKVKPWMDILQVHVISELPDIQHRACHIIMNLVYADKELATLVVEGPMLEILMAVSKQKDPKAEQARQAAEDTLKQAQEYGLIQAQAEGKAPSGLLEMLREQLRKTAEEEAKRRKEEEEEEERQRKIEEEEKKKREEEFEKKVELQEKRLLEEAEKDDDVDEDEEEIIVDKYPPNQPRNGPKIRELTDEEVAELEKAENKVIDSKDKKKEEGSKDASDDIDEEDLDRGDVWSDESGVPKP